MYRLWHFFDAGGAGAVHSIKVPLDAKTAPCPFLH